MEDEIIDAEVTPEVSNEELAVEAETAPIEEEKTEESVPEVASVVASEEGVV